MKPRHLKKPHNDEADPTQATIPEGIMSDDFRERIEKRAYELYIERAAGRGAMWKIGLTRSERL